MTLKPLKRRRIPYFPGVAAVLGPGLVWAGLSQGSGELIWWPYMVAKYGISFLGWLIVFASIQIWYNQEIGRYTLATGEGIITGLFRLDKRAGWITVILVSMIFTWVGGYAGAAASAIYSLTNYPPGSPVEGVRLWSLIVILTTMIVVFLGPSIYRVIETVESFAAVTAMGGLLAVALISPDVARALPNYLAGFTQFSWPPFPGWEMEDYKTWVTLMAYTGAGGIWNLAYSYWVREKGYGQARHVGRIRSPLTGAPEAMPESGYDFIVETEEDREEWRRWVNWLWTDNLIGVTLNTFTIILTTLLTYSILVPRGVTLPRDYELVEVQSQWMETLYGVYGKIAFLAIAFLFLFDIYLVAGDLFSRFIAETSYVVVREEYGDDPYLLPKLILILSIPTALATMGSEVLFHFRMLEPLSPPVSYIILIFYLVMIPSIIYLAARRGISYTRTYYLSWIAYTSIAIPQIMLSQPGGLILLTGAANTLAMAFLMTCTTILSYRVLPKIHGAGTLVRQRRLNLAIEIVIAIAMWIVTIWFVAIELDWMSRPHLDM